MSNATGGLRVACWSGPRNISTAMMRAWENRADTVVVDEPLYAHYLMATGLDHPGRERVLATGECDWRRATTWLTGPIPGGADIWYQKHMAQHLLDGMVTDWLDDLTHTFLIRHPREVLLSYTRTREPASALELGFLQQAELFDHIAGRTGTAPVVIDAADFLRAPEAMLRHWCDRLGVDFTPRMLHWPAGRRTTDGVWAPYWYAAVEQSTGFTPPQPSTGTVPERLQGTLEQCMPAYERLHAWRLKV